MNMPKANISNANELEFVIFCIENVAFELSVDGKRVYKALSEKSRILQDYIIPRYDVLHSHGRGYIINEIVEVMTEMGVEV